MRIRCADHVTPLYPQKLALTSPTGGGRSVGIVLSRTKATELTWCSLCVECFVRISDQPAVFAIYVINWLVFITVVESVYSAVRTDSLYKADYVKSLKKLNYRITGFFLAGAVVWHLKITHVLLIWFFLNSVYVTRLHILVAFFSNIDWYLRWQIQSSWDDKITVWCIKKGPGLPDFLYCSAPRAVGSYFLRIVTAA